MGLEIGILASDEFLETQFFCTKMVHIDSCGVLRACAKWSNMTCSRMSQENYNIVTQQHVIHPRRSQNKNFTQRIGQFTTDVILTSQKQDFDSVSMLEFRCADLALKPRTQRILPSPELIFRYFAVKQNER